MKTIVLRYAENFAPDKGTIAAHKDVIKNLVMFGMENLVIQYQIKLLLVYFRSKHRAFFLYTVAHKIDIGRI